MLKNISTAKLFMSSICVVFLVSSSCSYAEIYKWTDESGRVHYSDKKVNAGKLNAEKIEVEPSQNLMQRAASPNSSLKQKKQESARRTTGRQQRELVFSLPKPKPITDPCKLARKILRGDVTLSNGLPTGKYEMEVAKRDVRKFCN